MKQVRLFLMSGLALLALSGVAVAAEGPAASSSATAQVTQVSTTVSPEGSLTTYSDGTRVFTPASPDVISECPEQYFCLWENINFSGRMVQFHTSGRWENLSQFNFVDKASSFYNHRNNSSYISSQPNDAGPERCFAPGGSGNFGSEWNDRAAAAELAPYTTC
jgi:hypothetical protein